MTDAVEADPLGSGRKSGEGVFIALAPAECIVRVYPLAGGRMIATPMDPAEIERPAWPELPKGGSLMDRARALRRDADWRTALTALARRRRQVIDVATNAGLQWRVQP